LRRPGDGIAALPAGGNAGLGSKNEETRCSARAASAAASTSVSIGAGTWLAKSPVRLIAESGPTAALSAGKEDQQ
jgi:hypothetical protein